MKFYSQTFFCDDGEGIKVEIEHSKGDAWPFTVRIKQKYSNPSISFHLSSERDLINFKNSVISQFESAVRNIYRFGKERSNG